MAECNRVFLAEKHPLKQFATANIFTQDSAGFQKLKLHIFFPLPCLLCALAGDHAWLLKKKGALHGACRGVSMLFVYRNSTEASASWSC